MASTPERSMNSPILFPRTLFDFPISKITLSFLFTRAVRGCRKSGIMARESTRAPMTDRPHKCLMTVTVWSSERIGAPNLTPKIFSVTKLVRGSAVLWNRRPIRVKVASIDQWTLAASWWPWLATCKFCPQGPSTFVQTRALHRLQRRHFQTLSGHDSGVWLNHGTR